MIRLRCEGIVPDRELVRGFLQILTFRVAVTTSLRCDRQVSTSAFKRTSQWSKRVSHNRNDILYKTQVIPDPSYLEYNATGTNFSLRTTTDFTVTYLSLNDFFLVFIPCYNAIHMISSPLSVAQTDRRN